MFGDFPESSSQTLVDGEVFLLLYGEMRRQHSQLFQKLNIFSVYHERSLSHLFVITGFFFFVICSDSVR